MADNLVAQPRLRWVPRPPLGVRPGKAYAPVLVLQQWWAQDLPSYMRDVAKGEWRDVPVETET